MIVFGIFALLAAAGAMYLALSRARGRCTSLTKHGGSALIALTVLLILFELLVGLAGDVQ